MSNLRDDIKKYAEKYPFFVNLNQLVEENQLSIFTLTEALSSLTEAERKTLFATTLNLFSTTNSNAAQLIKAIYEAIGAKPYPATFKALITGIPLSASQANALYNAPYHNWRRSPFDESKKKLLEHELKGYLKLNNPQNKSKSLADALLNEDVFPDQKKFSDHMIILAQKAPKFMPQLLEDLHNKCIKSDQPDLIKQLVEIANAEPVIASAMRHSKPKLVAAWIEEHPQQYFNLTRPLQTAVLELFRKNDNEEAIQRIADEAASINDYHEILLDGKKRKEEPENGLADTLYTTVQHNAVTFVHQDQKFDALRVIENYLRLKPNKNKQDFFKKLAEEIKKDGLSQEILQKHLQAADNQKLFAKWSGLANSRAAGVMAELHAIANLGHRMNAQDIQQMVNQKELPKPKLDETGFIKQKINEVLSKPHKTSHSYITHYVGSVFSAMQAKSEFLTNQIQMQQRKNEATYQQYLVDQGLQQLQQSSHPIFDLQGRAMLFIKLNEENYEEILKNMGQEKQEGSTAQTQVESLLGAKITNPTFCNLDIMQDEELQQKFQEWVNFPKGYRALESSFNERGSIIKLQEEMTMHVFLSFRALENKILKNNPEQLNDEQLNQQIRESLMSEINALVREKVQEILRVACSVEKVTIDYEVLNNKLDKARNVLAPLCREKLVKKICAVYPDIDWTEEVKQLEKKDFTSTTATGLDYLHTDGRNQTVVRISGTNATAHDKKVGNEGQAFRILYRNQYTRDGTIIPYAHQTTEARVPSIAVIEEKEALAIQDVTDKLAHSYQELNSKAIYTNRPMIYNLLTSLHTKLYDISPMERSNQQRLSAEYILKGAHRGNLEQLNNGNHRALVYVQNIPVNQHTNRLDDEAFDNITKEATLMTDVAVLSTLNHHAGLFPSTIQESLTNNYDLIHKKYLSFLPQKISYFYDSKEGSFVQDLLRVRKAQWGEVKLPLTDTQNTASLAIKVLFKMYTQNMHWDPQFGMLAQTLSVFVEPISQAGCKSANERYQAISGRVDILKSISARDPGNLSEEELAVKKALINVIKTDKKTPVEEVQAGFAQLQKCLDEAYNLHNLQGAAASFALEDQGAGSKVRKTKNTQNPGFIDEVDTNIAETGYLKRLFQSCTSALQAHKAGLAKKFNESFKKEAPQQEYDSSRSFSA
jgi:hypothetical protein